MSKGPLFDHDNILQICFITGNLEKSAKWFAALLGVPVPDFIAAPPPEESKPEYLGQPARLGCRQAFFLWSNIMVEFIEPDENPSVWREVLERRGPCVHHLGFRTRNMQEKTELFEERGVGVLQKGLFPGGSYAYFDTENELGTIIEMLEMDESMYPL